MPTVFANGRSIVHKGDGQTDVSGPPDVCKTPSPGGPAPVPYVNVAKSSDLVDGTQSVKIEGHSVALGSSSLSTSTGDEPGSAGGIISSKTKGKLTWRTKSLDVIFEGEGVVRFGDVTLHNGNMSNTVAAQNGQATQSPQKKTCNDHHWGEIRCLDDGETAAAKKEKLRKAAERMAKKGNISGSIAHETEALAAEHNGVVDGNCMSGPNEKSKLFAYCTKCGARGKELDHVICNDSGKITTVVEVKSGRCHIDKDQLKATQEIAGNCGASVLYKLRGPGADVADEFLKAQGIESVKI